jgi:acetoin utilization protein AcuB
MLVKDNMSRHPYMLEESSSIVDAQRYMGEVRVRYLPVVGDGKRLTGLITRDTLLIEPGSLDSLNVWEITRYLSSLKVKKVMIKAKDVFSIEEDATIESAALLMIENTIGCLPVLKGKVVVGLITQEGILAQLCQLLVTERPGIRVSVKLPDISGEHQKLADQVQKQGWEILSIGGVPDPKDKTHYSTVIKIATDAPLDEVERIINLIEGQTVLDIRQTI